MAYYEQTCDGYFVESHGVQGKRFRDELRERERFAKRQTQLAIAEELSELASHEYRADILLHMEEMESKTLPDVASIDIQTEIQWFMRPYLLDFLIEAHTAFGLLPETLFLTINLLDRYCSKRVVYKKHYQLVGCSALLIASKYGDRKDRVPTIKELKAMCCSLYEDDMFSQMEWHVLQTLDWAIGHPTIDSFLDLALEHEPYDPEVQHMAYYISEIAMFHKEFISKRPSDMARTSLALARCILGRLQAPHGEWTSRYEPQTLVALSQELHQPSSVLSRKYASTHLSRVSNIMDDFLARHASIARGYVAPPTPPAETATDGFGKPLPTNPMPITPTKPPLPPNVNNGCPTPPITPTNNQYFAGPNMGIGNFGLPPTPVSMGNHGLPQPQQYNGSCRLPSIHQIAPGL